MQNIMRLVMLAWNVNTFFGEIHSLALSFTLTYAAYQGQWGAVFWDLSSRYILLDQRAPMWQNTGHGAQNTYCMRLGFYGPLHIDRDRSASATQTIPFLSSHNEVRKKTSPGPRVNLRNAINLPSAKISSTRDRLLLEYVKKGAYGGREGEKKRRAKHCDFVSLFGWQSLKCCARLSCPGSGRVIWVSALPLI